MGSGRSGLQLVRSSQSLTVFSWLIPVNLCVAQFASERRARTDELFVSHGGRLSTLYRAKFGVVCGFCLLLQLAFYGICITITAIQMGIAPALGTVLLFCAVSAGNLLVLGGFPGIGVGPYTLAEKPCCCGTGDQYSAVGRSAALSGTV